VKIRVLGCYGGQLLGFHLSSFLVNDSILLDAGSPTVALTLEEQRHISHVFISHTHLDHIQDIAFLADNRSLKRMGGTNENRCITIHSLQENLDTLKTHFLNDAIWPDFTKIPTPEDPILKFSAIESLKKVTVDGVSITPIPMTHPVPCTGFLLDQGDKQFILRGLIIDCSFPNAYSNLAEISGHLTPKQMARELKKLHTLGKTPMPETLNIMTAEVEAENIPHVRMLTQVDELLL